MPRSCTCCAHEQTAALSKSLLAGGSLRTVAGRFGVSHVAAGRHLRNCLRSYRKAGDPAASSEQKCSPSAGRFETLDGRCSACGLSLTETDATSLLHRAERILWISETIAAQAQRDDDSRLALQAVDRARSALETMMKATGLIGGDAQVTVNIDQRAQGLAVLAKLPDDLVEALARGDSAALDAVLAASQPALPPAPR